MKYGLVLLLIFFIGCYRSVPDIVYVPVSIPSYGETVESVYEPERFECNCDNYHDHEHECYSFDYEYECPWGEHKEIECDCDNYHDYEYECYDYDYEYECKWGYE